ncbi:MAG TPA: FKBP-type peptidyl-prolyl cis-trans isomerase [Anaeromyxobacter sp.]|nr:FKBP-type peptidyl-prolyl cis-trans isomerase [Anaeromyxobacter sp.]
MRTVILALTCLALALPAAGEDKPPAAPKAAAGEGDADQALNAIGHQLTKSLGQLALTPAEFDKVVAGMREEFSGKAKPGDDKSQENLRTFVQARFAAAAEKEKARGSKFLEDAAKEKGALKTANGTVVVPVKEGSGASPGATDTVKVNYTGTFVDGTVFDASSRHGATPAEFSLGGGVIPCWSEALQKMKVGGKAKVVCPPAAAYGERGSPPVIPANATLAFQIELVDVVKK